MNYQEQQIQLPLDDSHIHRASRLQIAGALIGAIFIVAFVLFGINSQRDESGPEQTAGIAAATAPQPAPTNADASKAHSSTTGQGNTQNDSGAQSSKDAKPDTNNANQAPANAKVNSPAKQ